MRTSRHRDLVADQPRSATASLLFVAAVTTPAMLIGAIASLAI